MSPQPAQVRPRTHGDISVRSIMLKDFTKKSMCKNKVSTSVTRRGKSCTCMLIHPAIHGKISLQAVK